MSLRSHKLLCCWLPKPYLIKSYPQMLGDWVEAKIRGLLKLLGEPIADKLFYELKFYDNCIYPEID